MQKPSGLTYRDAGVDIDAGDALVDRIKPLYAARSGLKCWRVSAGFGALVGLPQRYREPVLVSGTDGVGTKLRLAIDTSRHDRIGIDLVAMCVNDVAVQGAEPLFFLDYYATGKLSVDVAESVITGIAEGCLQAGCALVGGETAEMPACTTAMTTIWPASAWAWSSAAKSSMAAASRPATPSLASPLPACIPMAIPWCASSSKWPAPMKRTMLAGKTLFDRLLEPTRIYVKSMLQLSAALPGIRLRAYHRRRPYRQHPARVT